MAECGSVAASSNDIPAGIGWKALSFVQTYSAKLPCPPTNMSPKTRSPGFSDVTPGPTSSTMPAASVPIPGSLGARMP